MFNNRPDLILWDWDNTLIDTRPVVALALGALARQNGKPLPSDRDIDDVIGSHIGQYWFDVYGADPLPWIDRFLDLYQMYADRVSLFPETRKILAWVQSCGIPQVVASNKNQDILDGEADRFGLRPYFDKVVGATPRGFAKPTPEYARHVLGQAHPRRMIMIGDGLSDMLFAKTLGATGVLIRPKHSVGSVPHDVQADNLSAVWQWLRHVIVGPSSRVSGETLR